MDAKKRPLDLGVKYDYDEQLSEFASKNKDAWRPEGEISSDPTRTPYERDYHRILFSNSFKRLRHKTQVFFRPENDHICTRLDHALQVASISETICRNLRLNSDLAQAIALGHDIGHAPFGHAGEEALNKICTERGIGSFKHEAQSLRVVTTMKELHGTTLQLTYQVSDGILCHCGEKTERLLQPDKSIDLDKVNTSHARKKMPFTLEGCVVRYADRIAYLPADLQDAIELGVVKYREVPNKVRKLGSDSGEMIGVLTEDIISISKGNNFIGVSNVMYERLQEFHEFSQERIYDCEMLVVQRDKIRKMLRDLFDFILEVLVNTSSGRDTKARSKYKKYEICEVLFRHIKDTNYTWDDKPEQIAIDFIAGMTDQYAYNSYTSVFLDIGT